jgi:hypothetical protein
LIAEGVGITATAWLKEADSGQWYLYIATPLVGEDGAKKKAYRRVDTTVRDLQRSGFWIDLLEVKVIHPGDSVAKAMVEINQRYPATRPIWYGETRLGRLSIDGAYIYPPPATVPS